MPRSAMFLNAEYCKMETGDTYVTCPYNVSHQILKSRIQMHLVKCKKNYPTVQKSICPFDATHLVDKEDLYNHIRTCDKKHIVESHKYALNTLTPFCHGDLGIAPFHFDVTTSDERWDDAEADVDEEEENNFTEPPGPDPSPKTRELLLSDDDDDYTPLRAPKEMSKALKMWHPGMGRGSPVMSSPNVKRTTSGVCKDKSNQAAIANGSAGQQSQSDSTSLSEDSCSDKRNNTETNNNLLEKIKLVSIGRGRPLERLKLHSMPEKLAEIMQKNSSEDCNKKENAVSTSKSAEPALLKTLQDGQRKTGETKCNEEPSKKLVRNVTPSDNAKQSNNNAKVTNSKQSHKKQDDTCQNLCTKNLLSSLEKIIVPGRGRGQLVSALLNRPGSL